MSTEKKQLTWRELREFCNTKVTSDFLDEPVGWTGEYRGGKMVSVSCFEEDMINPSGDGIEPISVYEDDEDIDIESEAVIFHAGHPILWVD